jgi:hypothetical protein
VSTSHGITLSRHGVLEAPHTRRASPLLAGFVHWSYPQLGQFDYPTRNFARVLSGHVTSRTDVTSLDDVPACRHAEGTISSSDESDVWRMASEDSQAMLEPFLLIVRTRRIFTAVIFTAVIYGE